MHDATPSRRARQLRRGLIAVARMLALALVLLWSAFPIALLVLGSLRLPRDIFSDKNLFVFTPTLQNYVNLWQRWPDFFHNLVNSLLIALGATALTLVISFLAGYVYARRQGRLLTASAGQHVSRCSTAPANSPSYGFIFSAQPRNTYVRNESVCRIVRARNSTGSGQTRSKQHKQRRGFES